MILISRSSFCHKHSPFLEYFPASDADEKHAAVQKLNVMSFNELYEALEKLELLKGRFIVFPHVSDRGYKTLLRKDFEKHYISMPCVGGYLDGAAPVEPRSAGVRSITSGQDKNWGNKPVGVFQTSDSRSRDFSRLGMHCTWVKWAKPTAEALRQACLARHSRISHSEPKLPPIRLTRLEVSNSKFMGPLSLEFNPQYNSVIGSRGTGKSTIFNIFDGHSAISRPEYLKMPAMSWLIFSGGAKVSLKGLCCP